MSRITHVFRYINTLSIDVLIGAVISASFFSSLLNVELTFSEFFSLGLIVWIIYTTDHLLDAKRIRHNASTHRHLFHQTYFVPICFVMGLVVMGSVSLLFFVRTPIISWGIGLMSIVGIYLIYLPNLGLLKELFGSILYTGGVILPSISLSYPTPLHISILFIIIFAITAWINLILFSWISHNQDKIDHQISFSLTCGYRATQIILCGLFVIQFGILLYCTINYFHLFLSILVLVVMNLGLFMIFFNSKWFVKQDRYRIAGDAIFFFPILYFLYTEYEKIKSI